MDFSGLKRADGIPTNAKAGLSMLSKIVVAPVTTIRTGIVINMAIFFVLCGMLAAFSRLNWITGLMLAVMLALYFYYYCMENIPIGSVGIPLLFKKRNLPWTKALAEGDHWRPYPIGSVAVVEMKEHPVALTEFSVNAANSGIKKKQGGAAQSAAITPDKKDIVRLRVAGKIQLFVWDPWRFLSIENAEETLTGIVRDSMIAAAQHHDDTALMQNNSLLIKPAQRSADRESDHFGACVKKILLEKIEPWNPKILDAHERIGIETLEAVADEVAMGNNIERIKTYTKDLGISTGEAIKLHANAQGKMPREEVIVTSSDPLVSAAAVLGQKLGKNKTDDSGAQKPKEGE